MKRILGAALLPLVLNGLALAKPHDSADRVVQQLTSQNYIAWAVETEEGTSIRFAPRKASAVPQEVWNIPKQSEEPPGHMESFLRMDATADWLVIGSEGWDSVEGVRGSVDLYGVNLAKPDERGPVAGEWVGARGRFVWAVGNGLVAYQVARPQPPDGRFTTGRTRVLRLGGHQDWDLVAPWAKRLRITSRALVIDRLDGGTERVSLPTAVKGTMAVVALADFDGDGRADLLLQKENEYGSILDLWVELSTGGQLSLPLGQGRYGGISQVLTANLGGPVPLIVVSWGTGGSWGEFVEAFAYRNGKFGRLSWDGAENEAKSLSESYLSLDLVTRSVIVGTRTHDPVGHDQFRAYRHRGEKLVQVGRWYGPWPDELGFPDDRLLVTVAALNTVGMRLPAETPRYFVDPRAGASFYTDWKGRVPEGTSFYTAHDGNMAPEGMFAVWPNLPQGAPAFGLEGQVSFVRKGGRDQIAWFEIREVPLRVKTLDQALTRVRGRSEVQDYLKQHPGAELTGGFWEGRWQVHVRSEPHSVWGYYFIDPRTGQIQGEPAPDTGLFRR